LIWSFTSSGIAYGIGVGAIHRHDATRAGVLMAVLGTRDKKPFLVYRFLTSKVQGSLWKREEVLGPAKEVTADAGRSSG